MRPRFQPPANRPGPLGRPPGFWWAALRCWLGFLAPEIRAADAAFTEVAAAHGVDYVQFAPTNVHHLDPYYFTGGAAAVDVDSDGWVDLFVTRMDAPSILFRNRGGRFEPVPAESLGISLPFGSNGAHWADIDNDGDQDLYVTTVGGFRNQFYLNQGDGTFVEAAAARGVAVENLEPLRGFRLYAFGAAFGDYDRDGFLDLFTTSWRDGGTGPGGHPGGVSNRLLRNQGARNPGFFTDATGAARVEMNQVPNGNRLADGTFGFAPRFADLDNDGHADLVVAADFGSSRLFWNNRDGTFTDGTVAARVGTDENGMGSTIGDFDGDGNLDWFVTSIFDPTMVPGRSGWGGTGNRLYRNLGGRRFEDVTDRAGVRQGGWGWGASFFDLDNDGDLDLVMTNGIDLAGLTQDDPFNEDPMRLWRNEGDGTFTEIAEPAGIRDRRSGKGLLVFDFDQDGDLDVFVVNNRGRPVLYRNDTSPSNHWIQFRLRGVASNRDAIGARITLTASLADPARSTQVRDIDGGSNFLGQNERLAHFGLGPSRSTVERVDILWPSGKRQRLEHLPVDARIDVTEKGNFRAWQERFFSQEALDRPEVSGPRADPDGDGWPNLAEYATGGNPGRSEPQPRVATQIALAPGGPRVSLSTPVDPDAIEGQVRFESATAVAGPWSSVPAELTEVSDAPPLRRVTVTLPGDRASQFLRVRFLLIPGATP